MSKGPYLPNLEPIVAAGIDPKTGLPVRMASPYEGKKPEIKKQLRILDEQNAVNRYTWYNLPLDITSQELERLLYYYGQLCFFYLPEMEKFYITKYALDGTIDFYGRYNTVHPVPIASGMDEKDERFKNLSDYLANVKLNVLYDVPWKEDVNFFEGKHCVLLHDYTKQLGQNIIARQIIQEPILDIMADCIPFMRTNLLNSTGVMGLRIPNQNDTASVEEASRAIDAAALCGKKYVGIVGNTEFQELTGGNLAKSEEFMLAMQSLDNYRLSLYGLDNGGLFQKKSHMLAAEQEMNAGATSIPLQDGLSIRQHFCNVVNSVTGVGTSCEIAESVLGADMNGDGVILDEQDQTGTNPGQRDHTMTEG